MIRAWLVSYQADLAAGGIDSVLSSHRTHPGQPRPGPGPSLDAPSHRHPGHDAGRVPCSALASHDGLHRAADNIGVPYSTLRGWLKHRGGDAGEHGEAFRSAVTALRGHLDGAKRHLKALLGDVNAMSQDLDTLEQMLGRETDTRAQG